MPLPLFAFRYEFFNELYHRFLLTPKVTMKCLCLQALTIVYGKCYEEIGPFTDTKYIVGMLDRVSNATMIIASSVMAMGFYFILYCICIYLFWERCISSEPKINNFLCLQCTDKLERDRLILFLNKLILNKVGY